MNSFSDAYERFAQSVAAIRELEGKRDRLRDEAAAGRQHAETLRAEAASEPRRAGAEGRVSDTKRIVALEAEAAGLETTAGRVAEEAAGVGIALARAQQAHAALRDRDRADWLAGAHAESAAVETDARQIAEQLERLLARIASVQQLHADAWAGTPATRIEAVVPMDLRAPLASIDRFLVGLEAVRLPRDGIGRERYGHDAVQALELLAAWLRATSFGPPGYPVPDGQGTAGRYRDVLTGQTHAIGAHQATRQTDVQVDEHRYARLHRVGDLPDDFFEELAADGIEVGPRGNR